MRAPIRKIAIAIAAAVTIVGTTAALRVPPMPLGTGTAVAVTGMAATEAGAAGVSERVSHLVSVPPTMAAIMRMMTLRLWQLCHETPAGDQ